MPSFKRIKFNARRHEDYPKFLMSPCFKISPHVQFKKIPTTGEEYLLKVIVERRNIPAVSKCDKMFWEQAVNDACIFNEPPKILSAPENLKPTLEWQNNQVALFNDIRLYVSQMLDKYSTNIKRVEVGRNTLSGWKYFIKYKNPTLTIVLGMRQSMLDYGLEYMLLMLDEIQPGDTIAYKLGRWIYAFLACKGVPLLPSSMSILRNLARKCAEIRSHLNQESEDAVEAVAPLNVFICLVTRFFGQYDLAD